MSPIVVLLVPALPLVAAAFSLLRAGRAFAPIVTLVASGGGLVIAGALFAMGAVSSHDHAARISLADGWLGLDAFGMLIILLVTLVGTLAALYSWGYMSHHAHDRADRDVRTYYVFFNLFLFAIVMIPLSTNIALVWITVELTTLFSVLLVGFDRTREALEAAWKYVMLTLIGAAIALLGILILYRGLAAAGGTAFTWRALAQAASTMPPGALGIAFLLVLIGFGTKVGLVPMHTWLPDAHSQAPSPVCAILSGIETAAILSVVLRVLGAADQISSLHADTWAMAAGLVSVGVAAALIIQVSDFKRLFAFSTVEHMGIIFTAAGIGGTVFPSVAPYQLMTHALAKPLCFFAAGGALMLFGTRDISSSRGLFRRSPVAGAGLLVGGLAVTGAPPFALFLSELSILQAGISRREYVVVALLALFVIVAFCAVTFHICRIVFGAPAVPGDAAAADVSLPWTCGIAMALAAIPLIVFGFYVPGPIHDMLSASGGVLFAGGSP